MTDSCSTKCKKPGKDDNSGSIRIYSGPPPATVDAAVSGTLLVTITLGLDARAPGSETNDFEYEIVSNGEIEKDSDVWSAKEKKTGKYYGRPYFTTKISKTMACEK